MELGIRGEPVIRVCFDAALTVLIGEDCELRVETEAVIRSPRGEAVRFDPGFPGSAASHLVHLARDSVAVAEAETTGEFRMVFESGAELTVAPDVEYESWSLVGPKGRRVVCTPGGELVLWGERESS